MIVGQPIFFSAMDGLTQLYNFKQKLQNCEPIDGSLVAPTPAWCGGSRGLQMAHEAGNSLPLWLATLSRIATCCTGATTTGARRLHLHRSFSH